MTDVSALTWDEVRATLARVLVDLPDGGFVVLGEPEPPRVRPPGLRGLLGGRAEPVATRFVQARRDRDVLGAYRHQDPVAAAGAVATLLVTSLEILGLAPTGPLELTTG